MLWRGHVRACFADGGHGIHCVVRCAGLFQYLGVVSKGIQITRIRALTRALPSTGTRGPSLGRVNTPGCLFPLASGVKASEQTCHWPQT